jgi:adenylosuccinate lyase
MTDFSSYISPFSWRYASIEMRQIWSEENKRKLWRQIWLALAEVQSGFGLVSQDQLADIQVNVTSIDIPLSLEFETVLNHDLMAELKAFASQCKIGGGSLHLGATSMDIEDNADALRLRQATQLIIQRLAKLLGSFSHRIIDLVDLPCIAFTHLQPAEPTTYGARLAFYAQDLLEDYQALTKFLPTLRGKGFKGAVGTSAAYAELVGVENLTRFENSLSQRLDLPFFEITSQTYSRRQEYALLSLLASVALTLNKFAFDIRLLQSPLAGEVSEPFSKSQVGSSAMPFKRNPIQSEKIDSLSRSLALAPLTAWHNAAHSLLERTLDDSANRRSLLPEAFLTLDELLLTSQKLLDGFQLHPVVIQRNLDKYSPFAATERLLMALAQAGADRQQMHETIREISLVAWQAIQSGQPNPLIDLLIHEDRFSPYLSIAEIESHLNIANYLGDAPLRARSLARKIDLIISL